MVKTKKTYHALVAYASAAGAKARSFAPKLALFALALLAFVLVAAHPAMAQTTSGAYGLGQNGAPAASDFTSATQGFSASISPMLTAILPYLIGILAVWKLPWLLKKLVSGFTH